MKNSWRVEATFYVLLYALKGRPLGFTKHLDGHLRPPPLSQHNQNENHCLYPKTHWCNSSQTFNVCMYVYYVRVCMQVWSFSQVSKYSSTAWLHFIFSLSYDTIALMNPLLLEM